MAPVAKRNVETPTVYIVDDEAYNRDIAARYVGKLGLLTKEFGSGAAVIDALAENVPDLMLLDIHMPGMNGLEVLEKAREFGPKTDFPILMVTADSDPDSVVEAFELGANDYVTKPIESRTLRARLEAHLYLSIANRQNREFAEGAERLIADQELDIQKRNEDLVREVTLRMKTEEELREAKRLVEGENRAKSEFLALLSHELITPLHVAVGFSDLISAEGGEAVNPEQSREYAGHISQSMRQLLATMKDMLTLARYDVGKLNISESEIEFPALIKHAVDAALAGAKSNAVKIEVECDSGIELLGDKVLLTRAIASIVSNAVKFSHEGAVCSVEGSVRGDGAVSLRVRDTGSGFDVDKVEDLLKPFRQSSCGLDRRHQGIGVGLPLAKAVLEKHGASIDFNSKPGVGTEVTLVFPAYRTLSAGRSQVQQAAG
jgi:signal transduction histidine kinase